jgi:hypothetical protein
LGAGRLAEALWADCLVIPSAQPTTAQDRPARAQVGRGGVLELAGGGQDPGAARTDALGVGRRGGKLLAERCQGGLDLVGGSRDSGDAQRLGRVIVHDELLFGGC